MRDPFTNEIGKTLVFCAQKHALKITTILNELAEKYFPNQYQSDFAIQVTSDVTNPEPQQMTIDFKNNTLRGNSPLNELYKTSKARVCVTVGMMTTGYDCRDLLNICLFRPVFSPTEFIQMKGRGTRLFDFKESWIDEKEIPKTINSLKSSFKLFDYFKNYQYFEEEFDYDQVLKLPTGSAGDGEPPHPPTNVDEVFNKNIDPIQKTEEINIPQAGMRIDRDLYKTFKEDLFKDKQSYSTLKQLIENQNFKDAEQYFKEKYLEKSYSLDRLKRSLGLNVNISIKDLLLYTFGFISKIKNKDEILEEEFDKFDDKFKPDESSFDAVKQVFEAYVTDKEFRDKIDSGKYAELNVHTSGDFFFKLPEDLRNKIPTYVKENINLERFINA